MYGPKAVCLALLGHGAPHRRRLEERGKAVSSRPPGGIKMLPNFRKNTETEHLPLVWALVYIHRRCALQAGRGMRPGSCVHLHHSPALTGPLGGQRTNAKRTLSVSRRNEGSFPPASPEGPHLAATVDKMPTAHTLHIPVDPSSSSPPPPAGYARLCRTPAARTRKGASINISLLRCLSNMPGDALRNAFVRACILVAAATVRVRNWFLLGS